jgi:hypothetical protein
VHLTPSHLAEIRSKSVSRVQVDDKLRNRVRRERRWSSARLGTIDIESFVRQLSKWMRRFDQHFAEHVLQVTQWVELAPEEAAPTISRCASADFVDDWQWISPFVIPSVLWSLYSFLRTSGRLLENHLHGHYCRGDVDTTAAMAGAISGAHVGLKRLPSELVQHVIDQGQWGYEELVELSSRCYSIKIEEIAKMGKEFR